MLTQGYGINGSWWRPGTFDKLRVLLPEWISQELAVWQSSLLLLDQQIALLKTELAQSLQGPRPKGFGALSLTQLDREVFDYHRFIPAISGTGHGKGHYRTSPPQGDTPGFPGAEAA